MQEIRIRILQMFFIFYFFETFCWNFGIKHLLILAHTISGSIDTEDRVQEPWKSKCHPWTKNSRSKSILARPWRMLSQIRSAIFVIKTNTISMRKWWHIKWQPPFFHTLDLDDKCKLLMRPIWAMPKGSGYLDCSVNILYSKKLSRI